MKFTLKNKIILGAAGMLVLMMVSSTVAVSIIINRQNRNASYDYLDKSFNIIKDDISRNTNKLLSDARQLATINEMGSNLKFLLETGKTFKYQMLTNTYENIGKSMFNVAVTTNATKAAIYTYQGDLLSYFIKEGDQLNVGWIHNQDAVTAATFKGEEQPTNDSWAAFTGQNRRSKGFGPATERK